MNAILPILILKKNNIFIKEIINNIMTEKGININHIEFVPFSEYNRKICIFYENGSMLDFIDIIINNDL
jgi:hypothetical protein